MHNKILIFLIGSTNGSFIYLSAISAVIAALLPLTTIIFALYYDKSMERSSELFDAIREGIVLKPPDYFDLRLKLSRIVQTSSIHYSVFKWTLIIFWLTSYALALLWLMTVGGYIVTNIHNKNTSLSATDLFIIAGATTILILILIVFPPVFARVKDSRIGNIKRTGCPLTEASRMLVTTAGMSESDFIANVMCPKLSVLTRSNIVYVKFEQSTPLIDYNIVWDLHGNDWSVSFKATITSAYSHNLSKQTQVCKLKGQSWGSRRNMEQPVSIVQNLRRIDVENSRVYIISHDKSLKYVGSISNQESNQKIQISYHKNQSESIGNLLLEQLFKKDDFIDFSSRNQSQSLVYLLDVVKNEWQ